MSTFNIVIFVATIALIIVVWRFTIKRPPPPPPA
jgi:hypothetical protein